MQVGLPSDKQQYIHRLGRTARAGKGGGGCLLLCDFEAFFLSSLKDQPVKRQQAASGGALHDVQQTVQTGLARVPALTLSMGYQAWLGFYNSHLRRLSWSQDELVRRANDWVMSCCQAPSPPSLQAKTVGKMGLKGVAGLVIEGRNGVPHREKVQQHAGHAVAKAMFGAAQNVTPKASRPPRATAGEAAGTVPPAIAP